MHHGLRTPYYVSGEDYASNRDRCIARLFGEIAKQHNVPIESVYGSLGQNDRALAHAGVSPTGGLATRVARAALLVLIALGPVPASAAEERGGAWTDTWMEFRRPTTDWFGLRDTLAAWGITPSVRYATDLQANVLGGRRRGQAYAGELSVDVDLDLEKLLGLRGLSFHASSDWASGSNLSVDVGNVFTVAQSSGEGALTAARLQVSKDGVRPPQ